MNEKSVAILVLWLPLCFMLLPARFSGIHLTINLPLNKATTSGAIRQIYQDSCAGEKLVKVVGEAPLVKSTSG
jgi:N-acetyl-gamma-glutamylphosphate reductase